MAKLPNENNAHNRGSLGWLPPYYSCVSVVTGIPEVDRPARSMFSYVCMLLPSVGQFFILPLKLTVLHNVKIKQADHIQLYLLLSAHDS